MRRTAKAIGRRTIAYCAGELLRLRETEYGHDLEIITAKPAGSYLWRTCTDESSLAARIREWCIARRVEVPEEFRLRSDDLSEQF